MTIEKSSGSTPSEQLLARLADSTFLNLWSFPNPFKEDSDELCDLLVVFENNILIFFDRESDILKNLKNDPSVLWKRWKRKVIDQQIRATKGAEKYIRSGQSIYLDSLKTTTFPVSFDPETAKIFKFIVAHGAKDACRFAHEDNESGSLAISYTDAKDKQEYEFFINLDRNDPVHILDSENLEIIFDELDTISDFIAYFTEKETAISKLKFLQYLAEEDLVAYYFRNFDAKTKKHTIKIGKGRKRIDGFSLHQGFWKEFEKNPSYIRKKVADEPSYFWDKLISKTGQNILDGRTKGNADVFSGKSPIHEMAKENRFSRRALSKRILDAVDNFPPPADDSFYRNLTFAQSEDDTKAYVFLQLLTSDYYKKDYENEYAPKRRMLLEIACGVAKNKFPKLMTIVGIAVDAPKYSDYFSEDFVLLECDQWDIEKTNEYNALNKEWRFFETGNATFGKENINQFPRTPGRNEACYCGSGVKYKKCHGSYL